MRPAGSHSESVRAPNGDWLFTLAPC